MTVDNICLHLVSSGCSIPSFVPALQVGFKLVVQLLDNELLAHVLHQLIIELFGGGSGGLSLAYIVLTLLGLVRSVGEFALFPKNALAHTSACSLRPWCAFVIWT